MFETKLRIIQDERTGERRKKNEGDGMEFHLVQSISLSLSDRASFRAIYLSKKSEKIKLFIY